MRLIKFAVVGVGNTVLAYLLYVFLVKVGMHYQLALFADYLFGIVLGYYLNKYWTFSDYSRSDFYRYVLTYVVAFSLNAALLAFVVEYIGIEPVLGQLFSLLVVTMLSYIVQKYWVFKISS